MKARENCRELLASLSDYVDGTLQEELCSEIEQHMMDCENCRIVVDTLRKTITLYRASAGAPAMPNDVRERLYRRLNLQDFLDR